MQLFVRTYFKCLLLAVLVPLTAHSQTTTEVGLFLGVANYQGDLSPEPYSVTEVNFAVGGMYRQMFDPKLGFKASANFTNLSGNDLNKRNAVGRGLAFSTSLLEFSVHAEYHLLGLPRFNNAGIFDRGYSPYISIGVGLAFANAEVDAPEDLKGNFPEPDDRSTFFTIPVSAGIRFDLSEDFLFSLDVGWRPTFSDFLDGVSRNGNPDKNDWYFMYGLTMIYMLEGEVGESSNFNNR